MPTIDGSHDTAGTGARIGERYVVQEVLGRGGMAVVYRVLDAASPQPLALKQLLLHADRRKLAAARDLFKREFQTLAELDHPRVIRVFDYGIDETGPYYTMELLDGGNLTQCAPLPWQQACALIHDVCSSLALLHARRLIHRDVSPQNVRRTPDGRAKLIDFGAMAAMGPSSQAVGTPAFTAPEVVQRGTLDGRSDLFSLGTTLYFALTGRLPYPARSFAHLREAWSMRPPPPSAIVAEIPARLDALVVGMISLDPALRPRSAFEVMSQLSALAGLERHETLEASSTYLDSPPLFGRDALLAKLRRRVTRARLRRGSALLIEGPTGSGRTRALKAATRIAKTEGMVALLASGKAAGTKPLSLAQVLLCQLVQALPLTTRAAAQAVEGLGQLFEPDARDGSAAGPPTLRALRDAAAQRGTQAEREMLIRLLLQIAQAQPLLLAVDDVDHVDQASRVWLAELADRAAHKRLLLSLSTHSNSVVRGADRTMDVLAERCARVPLAPLTSHELQALFGSIFGEVPFVALCADRIYRVTGGSLAASMSLLRHLFAHGRIQYAGGNWSLPGELEADALPATMDESFRARLQALSADARWLAGAHGLSAYGGLDPGDQARLFDSDGAARAERARAQLSACGVLSAQGDQWTIASETWVRAVGRHLDVSEQRELHARLAELARHTDKPELPTAHHYLCAEQPLLALERIADLLRSDPDATSFHEISQMRLEEAVSLFERALSASAALGRPALERAELKRWLCASSVGLHDTPFERVAPSWLQTLRRDSGLLDWEALSDIDDPGQRLGQALQRAAAHHASLPDGERTYPPDVAIKHLVNYVVVAIAIGARQFDTQLLRPLPELLSPLSPLSPIIDAIRQNAIATCEASLDGRYHRARERWLGVLEGLREVSGESLRFADPIRYAIAFALGAYEVSRGLSTAADWASQLDADPLQAVSGMYLRRLIRLQQGDVEGAESFRRRAELMAVSAATRPMFPTTIVVELHAYAMAGDLTGLQQAADAIDARAQLFPGWRAYQHLAHGQLALLHGQFEQALRALEQALQCSTPDPAHPERFVSPYAWAAAAHTHALLGLERCAQAHAFAQDALLECTRRDLGATEELVRALALAEARLGQYAPAAERLEALIAAQQAAGVIGLNLGASYEARTRIAIWFEDREATQVYAKLTAREYRHGRGSALGARYERLMSEARGAGVVLPPQLTEFETSILGTTSLPPQATTHSMIEMLLRKAQTAQQRAQRALRLICDTTSARGGQLYLVHETGLAWAAAHNEPENDTAQLELASECLQRAQNDDFGVTDFVSDTSAQVASSAALFTDRQGSMRQAVLITANAHGEPRHVAIAVVTEPDAAAANPDARAAWALVGKHLLEAGDTEGVAAGD